MTISLVISLLYATSWAAMGHFGLSFCGSKPIIALWSAFAARSATADLAPPPVLAGDGAFHFSCHESNDFSCDFLALSYSLIGHPIPTTPTGTNLNEQSFRSKFFQDSVNAVKGMSRLLKSIQNLPASDRIIASEGLLTEKYEHHGILNGIAVSRQRNQASLYLYDFFQRQGILVRRLALRFGRFIRLLFGKFRNQFLERCELSLNNLHRAFRFKFMFPNLYFEPISIHISPRRKVYAMRVAHNTPVSSKKSESCTKTATILAHTTSSDESIGYCLECGARVSRCGKPFIDEIACPKCGAINVYENSRQPNHIRRAP